MKGKNHDRVLDADGNFLAPFPQSPSDRRAYLNFISQMRRHGIELKD